MKNKTKIVTILTAVVMGLTFSSTSGFAAQKHKAAAQPVTKPLYNTVAPTKPLYDFVAPTLPLEPNATPGGPSSLNFNNTAWPGGQPSRY